MEPTVATTRPAIVTVDDDPGVSRAVARDLRRRYGDRYRIVRAESGAETLSALRELALRGEDVAVVLADHRMPGMTGVELLEQAMDLFPAARRVLLTAYADTEAAIEAINVVDLDYYLLKPGPARGEALPRRGRPARGVVRDRPAPPGRDRRRRAPVVGTLVAGARVPRAQPRALPVVPVGVRRGGAPAHGRAGRRRDPPLVVTPRASPSSRPTTRRSPSASGSPRDPRPTSTTSSSWAAGPRGSARRSTGRRKGCGRCSSSAPRPADRPGRARASTTTSGSPTGSRAPSSPSARAARPCGSAPRSSRRATPSSSTSTARPARCGSPTARRSTRTPSSSRPASPTGCSTARASRTSWAAACSTARRSPRRPRARTRRCTSSGRELRRAGGAVPRARGQAGHARRAGRLARPVHVVLPRRAGRGPPARAGPHPHGGGRGVRRRPPGAPRAARPRRRHHHARRVRVGVRVHRRRAPHRLARRRRRARPRGFVLAGPDLLHDGAPPAGWTLDRPPYHLETSVPGVFAAGDVRAESAKRVASAVGEGAMAVMLVHRYLEQL